MAGAVVTRAHPRQRRPVSLPAAVAVVALACAAAALAVALARSPSAPAPAARAAALGLADQKTAAEIAQLRAETRKLEADRGFLAEHGAFLTALLTGLAAVGGFSLALWHQLGEQSRQRELDREQRENELAQRELESRRHLDERFTSILTDLGSESDAVQAGAAVSLLTFLRPEQADFHRQVRLVSLANLKVGHPEPVRKLVLHVFEAAVRLAPLEPLERDLSNADLRGGDLARLDLEGADVGRATLEDADLENVVLRRACGERVVLAHARVCGPQADLHAVRLREVNAACEGELHPRRPERGALRGRRPARRPLPAGAAPGCALRRRRSARRAVPAGRPPRRVLHRQPQRREDAARRPGAAEHPRRASPCARPLHAGARAPAGRAGRREKSAHERQAERGLIRAPQV